MKRKTIITIGTTIILGISAYVTGYILTVSNSKPTPPSYHDYVRETEVSDNFEQAAVDLCLESQSFIVVSENAYLVVYNSDGSVYDRTTIRISDLNREYQIKVLNGYIINDLKELYEFLETHST